MLKNTLQSLLKNHHEDAFLWANQCCNYRTADAEDVLQLVYLKIMEGKAVYKEKASFKTWLFSVIRFTAIDYMRKQRSYLSLDDDKVISVVSTENLEDGSTVNYKAIIEKLPARQKQVLLLSFYHNMTLVEISEVTQLHIGTVRTHYERGKTGLRELLKRRNYGT